MEEPFDATEMEAEARADFSAFKLYLNLAEGFPDFVRDFGTKWEEWQRTISAAPDVLTALGPKIIPLVVYKLALDCDDARAVRLYTALQKDPDLIVDTSSANPKSPGKEILAKNFHRNRDVRNAIADWDEHCQRLLDYGANIVAHIMVEYKKKGGPLFWYELLHKIMWGHQTDLETISFPMQYAMWLEWFEKKNHGQAPHYRRKESSGGVCGCE
ncbi:hypothetical protein C8A01DRAFT_35564 [Parachaetomium inaequale]|uniref:Uncharacterized protein n=1 Tax=Parachaetomium inaequale TaxID=2588326 RepID=A0AAN6PGW4_9PEZI|nr:hypothetical protein C8A01DRAFT_35564 [Parachaetomium inaequale]